MQNNAIGFNSLAPIERLDKTLSFISYKKSVSAIEIRLEFQRLNIQAKELDDIIRVLDKLHNDGYIKPDLPNYKITFEGEFFFQIGGYAQKQKDDDLYRSHQEILKAVARRDSKITAWGSVVAGTGAIILILWEVLKVANHNWAKIQSFFSCS